MGKQVRKAACGAIEAFAKVIESQYLQSELLPLFAALTRDDQDSVRIVAVDKCATLGSGTYIVYVCVCLCTHVCIYICILGERVHARQTKTDRQRDSERGGRVKTGHVM